MKSKFINVFMFAAGAVIGSAVTWKVVTTKYEQIIQTEVDAFKLSYAEAMSGTSEQDDECEPEEEDEEDHRINWDELEDLDEEDSDDDMNDYERLVHNYTSEKGGAKEVVNAPYVISPNDFGELDDYNQISLTYYADDILEDEDGEIVTDIDELIGQRSLYTFGEYEDDSVFVRNERLRTDFEILKDYRTYAKAHEVSPDQVGD